MSNYDPVEMKRVWGNCGRGWMIEDLGVLKGLVPGENLATDYGVWRWVPEQQNGCQVTSGWNLDTTGFEVKELDSSLAMNP